MKLAVVGAGYWGPNLIRNLAALSEVETILVCDRDPARLEFVKSRFPKISTTTDLEVVLTDKKVEGVLLATPISTHGKIGLDILNAGKHLFVEKPLAGSSEEAKRLIEAAERKKRILMVGHTFEYSPPVLKIRELVEQGALGKILFISTTRVNLGLHQRDASVVWDLAPHDFSIIFHWLGETPLTVTATGRDCLQAGVPDVAFINLRFPSGVIANIEVAWLAPSKLRQTTIVGERKMLVYDDTENIEKVKIFDQGVDFKDPESFGEFQLSYRTGDIVSPRLASYEPLKSEMEHFVSCIKSGAAPKTDGASGLRVVRVLEATQVALETGHPVQI